MIYMMSIIYSNNSQLYKSECHTLRQYHSAILSKSNVTGLTAYLHRDLFDATWLNAKSAKQRLASCPYYNVFPSVGGRTRSCRTRVGFNSVTFSRRKSRGVSERFRMVPRRTVNTTGRRFPS